VGTLLWCQSSLRVWYGEIRGVLGIVSLWLKILLKWKRRLWCTVGFANIDIWRAINSCCEFYNCVRWTMYLFFILFSLCSHHLYFSDYLKFCSLWTSPLLIVFCLLTPSNLIWMELWKGRQFGLWIVNFCLYLYSGWLTFLDVNFMFYLLLLQYGRIVEIDLKIPPRPPGFAFVEVSRLVSVWYEDTLYSLDLRS